jgi:hypothetical protein
MKISLSIPAVFALILSSGLATADEPSKAPLPLSFYVVSKEKVDGWKYIDTPQFPKLGYISPTPDLVINQLKDVKPFKVPSISTTTDADGQTQMKQPPVIEITLLEEDAASFTALSRRAHRHQILTMVGDIPLMAPLMMAPIITSTFNLQLGNAGEDKKIDEALKKLVK